MKIKHGSLIKWIAFILFILCSGSQFGIDNARFLDVAFVFFAGWTYFLGKHRGIKKQFALPLLIMLLLLWGNYIVFLSYSPNINAYISYTLRMVGSLFLIGSTDYTEYKKCFVDIVIVIAVVSLIVYVLRTLNPADIGYLTTFGLFRTSNINGSIRNAGIFWEPGAYQVFLNLAVFFLLSIEKGSTIIKNKKLYVQLGVLIVTIITTLSTMAYLILIINFANLYFSNYKQIKQRNRILISLPTLIILIYVSYRMVISDTFLGKLYGGGNVASTTVRMNDLQGTIDIILKNPFGLGHGTTLYYNTLSQYFIVNNSTGLLGAICHLGILFAIIYVVYIYRFAKREIRDKWLIFLLIILVSGLSENFYYYPVYFVMLFGFERSRERKEKAYNEQRA